ncbi:dipeptidyl aminopeptidase/acylaminoacyl peptidase [Marmoricola sp. OAE513]|uniref:alpha/beta hydrolase family protein n=1 Tax=Marmoricola sp. OAE513 TaxID=2817894 RepID=UPI001D60FE65
MRARVVVPLVLASALLAGCSDDSPPRSAPPPSPSPTATAPSPTPSATPAPREVSVLGLATQQLTGSDLKLGKVRERTATYTSYDVTYRSRSTTTAGTSDTFRISGVLNVPQGTGPFPAVVLAHGYIDPAVYVRGQGMTRERGYLAARGYVALHVDYRNHAESGDDPDLNVHMRLGYTADVINAAKALTSSKRVPVDADRVYLFGRSMGGGVGMKALEVAPGLFRGAALWASVSSLESENWNRFTRNPTNRQAALNGQVVRRNGTPQQNPAFWRDNSARPFFDRITEPVLLVHGRNDDTCPPRWARATKRAMDAAGVDAQLAWYDDGHPFGSAFNAAMDRTVGFFANAGR